MRVIYKTDEQVIRNINNTFLDERYKGINIAERKFGFTCSDYYTSTNTNGGDLDLNALQLNNETSLIIASLLQKTIQLPLLVITILIIHRDDSLLPPANSAETLEDKL